MANKHDAESGAAVAGAARGSALVKRVSRMNGEEIAAAIEASHPMETEEAGVMDADSLAMHLVGARHEKRELVNLVRWLLIGAPEVCDHDWQEKHDDSGQVDGGPGDHWSWRECRVCGAIEGEAPNDELKNAGPRTPDVRES